MLPADKLDRHSRGDLLFGQPFIEFHTFGAQNV